MSSAALAAPRPAGLLGTLPPQPADSLLSLIGLHARDPRPEKIDLGVGVYRDEAGRTPILRAVRAAEAQLLATQDTKAYRGPEGDPRFVELLAPIALGEALACSDRLAGVQTPGGTGALRLGAELIARAAPDATVWIGTPTWPNHAPIFGEAGLRVALHPYFDAAPREMDFAAMIAALADARPGDILLLHGCCHNPTGTGFTIDQWQQLTDLVLARGLTPFIDSAYQGLGDGLDADGAGLRRMLAAVPEALLAYSCDKNFGLYRERVGALWALAAHPAAAGPTFDTMLLLARALWSMPPDHGAAIVRTILEDAALTADWHAELTAMRTRLNRLRTALAEAHPALAPIATQRGMFAMLPLDHDAVLTLRARHGLYMAETGRINIAGLREDDVQRFVAAIGPHLR